MNNFDASIDDDPVEVKLRAICILLVHELDVKLTYAFIENLRKMEVLLHGFSNAVDEMEGFPTTAYRKLKVVSENFED